MTDPAIHARLLALGRHLSKAEKMQDRHKAGVFPAHLVTNQALRDRFNALASLTHGVIQHELALTCRLIQNNSRLHKMG